MKDCCRGFNCPSLFRVNSLNRANVGTCAAIGADFRIDLIDITFRNSLYRALIDAGPAGGAIIIDFVSHDLFIYVLQSAERVNNAICWQI
jgi:hypothetical protein